jgi:hypothetical protein
MTELHCNGMTERSESAAPCHGGKNRMKRLVGAIQEREQAAPFL